MEKSTFETAYKRLNSAQKEAVDTIEGPVMVVAGPGTGKTQILTLRIAQILKKTDTSPENILALTFTNSGVQAMRKRLRSYIKDDAYRVSIYTFHSFAEHVLQNYNSYFPAQEFSNIITEVEKAKIIENILSQHSFSEIVSTYDRFSSLKQVMDAVGNIKQEGLNPEQFEARISPWEEEQFQSNTMFYKRATGKYKIGDMKPTEKKRVEKRVAKAREIATVFKAYQQALKKENLYDFSDMILTLLAELEDNVNLKLDLQEQYQYVLVDEHQDTNEGQNKLIELLTDAEHLEGKPNLFTVGDEKQSIYRFQGASDKAFEHFQTHYNDVCMIHLEQNYRSSASILDASHSLISKSLPNATELQSNSKNDNPVSLREFSDYKFELLFTTLDIKKKIKSGVPPDEIAVIYHLNKHLTEIKSLFQQYKVPYQVRSKDTLLDDPAISMLIVLIKVIENPHDDHNLGKLLFADFLKLNPLTVADTLRKYRGERRNETNTKKLIDLLKADISYAEFIKMLGDLQTYEANHHFSETFKEILHKSSFLETVLNSPESRNGLRKVDVLFNEFRQQADRVSTYRAKDFIAFVDAVMSYNLNIEVTSTQLGKGVQCMTAHGSKGLEFKHVYLVNTTRSNWEKHRGFPSTALPLDTYVGEIDDKRRLFYVALTRAKTNLHISSSKQDWSGRTLEPSQFISELDDSVIDLQRTEQFEIEQESELVRFFSNELPTDSVFDVDYLSGRFQEENLSVTALNNYLDCSIKYLFRNLIQLPDVYTPALRYGNAVHEALEKFFTASAEAKKIQPKTSLLKAYDKAMEESGFYGKDYTRYMLKGKQSLGMYYDYYSTDWTTDVLLEEYVRKSLRLPNLELTLSGKIDKIEFLEKTGSGKVRVVDYKTGKVFSEKSTKAQKQALERQIHFYHILLDGYKNGDVIVSDALLDFVEPSGKGEFEQKTLDVTKSDIDELKEAISEMADDVMSGDFLKKGCNKKDCESCAFWNSLHK